jgi:hypothetical protein
VSIVSWLGEKSRRVPTINKRSTSGACLPIQRHGYEITSYKGSSLSVEVIYFRIQGVDRD